MFGSVYLCCFRDIHLLLCIDELGVYLEYSAFQLKQSSTCSSRHSFIAIVNSCNPQPPLHSRFYFLSCEEITNTLVIPYPDISELPLHANAFRLSRCVFRDVFFFKRNWLDSQKQHEFYLIIYQICCSICTSIMSRFIHQQGFRVNRESSCVSAIYNKICIAVKETSHENWSMPRYTGHQYKLFDTGGASARRQLRPRTIRVIKCC